MFFSPFKFIILTPLPCFVPPPRHTLPFSSLFSLSLFFNYYPLFLSYTRKKNPSQSPAIHQSLHPFTNSSFTKCLYSFIKKILPSIHKFRNAFPLLLRSPSASHVPHGLGVVSCFHWAELLSLVRSVGVDVVLVAVVTAPEVHGEGGHESEHHQDGQ